MALTKRQENFIEYMVAHPFFTNQKCREDCNIPVSTYYAWKAKEEFSAALKKRIKEVWEDSERMAVETMLNLCQEGDFKASKYILDNLGYAPTQKVEANVTNAINISIEE